jgi:hypothetical protein
MKRPKIEDAEDREVATQAIVSFSGLVHAWKTGQDEELRRLGGELCRLGINVRFEKPRSEDRREAAEVRDGT